MIDVAKPLRAIGEANPGTGVVALVLQPMRGLHTEHTAQVVITGLALFSCHESAPAVCTHGSALTLI
jgi:hypothetical protein